MTPKEQSTVAVVVDVQNDFMRPDGRLYVHNLAHGATDEGAVAIVPVLQNLLARLREAGAHVVYTMDWHQMGDEEIDAVSPDAARGTYPPHCMGLSPSSEERHGAEIIPELAARPGATIIERDADSASALAATDTALAQGADICIHKQRFSVFLGNPAAETVFRRLKNKLGDPNFVVFGVARDVCVQFAIEGLADRGYRVTACPDATWGLGLTSIEDTKSDWLGRGVALASPEMLGSLPRRGRTP